MNKVFKIFDGWHLPIVIFDTELVITYCNKAYEAAVEKPLSEMAGRYVFDVFPESEDRVAKVREKFLTALQGQTTSLDETRFSLTGADGVTTERVWQATQEPFYDETGNITHIIQRADDVTHMVEARLERQLIREELDHRMKNIHAVVQAMARLSSRSAKSIEDYRDSFLARLESMSRAHERLLRAGMVSVSLREILEDEIKGVAPEILKSVSLEGPDVKLGAAQSRSVTMVIHELATNAVKYGCFSKDGCQLHVRWKTDTDMLQMIWSETGLKHLKTPTATGFGTKMINMVPNIECTKNFKADGLEVKISVNMT